jgi:hypothetical protein
MLSTKLVRRWHPAQLAAPNLLQLLPSETPTVLVVNSLNVAKTLLDVVLKVEGSLAQRSLGPIKGTSQPWLIVATTESQDKVSYEYVGRSSSTLTTAVVIERTTVQGICQ